MLYSTFKWSEQRLQMGTNLQWTATWAWEVSADSVAELQDDTLCLTAAGIPIVGYPHPANAGMTIQTLTAEPGLTLRVVRAQFGFGAGGSLPLNEPPTFNPQPVMINAPVDDDFDGNPLVNSAGFPIENLTEDVPALQIDVSLNMPFFDTVGALAAMYRTNDAPFTFPAIGPIDTGQGYVKSIRPAQPFKVGALFVKVLYSIFAQENGWKKRVPDKGLRGWYNPSGDFGGGDEGGGDFVSGPFCDKKGYIRTEPTLLDGTGLPIADDVMVWDGSAPQDPVVNPGYVPAGIDTTSPYISFLNFKVKGTYSFGLLPF